MTDEQRESAALEYLMAFDNGGRTSTGGSILDLFASDARVYFPKWGLANSTDEIGRLFGDVGGTLKAIRHDYATFNYIFSGSDVLVVGDQLRPGRGCQLPPAGGESDGREADTYAVFPRPVRWHRG
jgi:hypothetical protein